MKETLQELLTGDKKGSFPLVITMNRSLLELDQMTQDESESDLPALTQSEAEFVPPRTKRAEKRKLKRAETTPKRKNHQANPPISSPRSPIAKNTTIGPNEEDNPFITSNRFDPLRLIEPANQAPNSSTPKEPRTPLIYIKEVPNFPLLCKALANILKELGGFTTKTTREQVSVKTFTADGYRAVVKYLKDKNAKFHTYQLTTEKPVRAVIRHLHQTLQPETIKEALEDLGYNVKNVAPVLSKFGEVRKPLPIFFVDLDPTSESSKDIFKLQTLLYTRIKVEEPRKKTEIIQCHRCQQYRHSKGYCNHSPRCVKCAGEHLTSECKKNLSIPPKCALCGGAHPANYKGCSVHLELQKLTKNDKKPWNQPQRKNIYVQAPPPPPLTTSFADVASGRKSINHTQASFQDDLLSAKESPPELINPKSRGQHIPVIPPPSQSFDLILSKFLNDFQTLIKPMVDLLTPLISLLTSLLPSILHQTK